MKKDNSNQPKKNKGYEVQNLRARALNAERMVQKLTDEIAIIRGHFVIQNYAIVVLIMTIILLLVL